MTRVVLAAADEDLALRVKDAADGDVFVLPPGRLPVEPARLFEQLLDEELPDVLVIGPAAAPDAVLSLASRLDVQCPGMSTVLVAQPSAELWQAAMRAGIRDVIHPATGVEDLRMAIDHASRAASGRRRVLRPPTETARYTGRVITIASPKGGVGKTTVSTNLAIGLTNAAPQSTVLVDLDVQFGDVGFQLGLRPKLSLADLLDAGTRLDGDLLRATTTDHASGLKVITAPGEMMPLEGISSEHVLRIVDMATREFGTVFVDLPTNWTNWSLSLVARSDLVILVSELTVAGLNRARRQLNLLESQDLSNLDVRVIVNRYEKSQSRTIRPADVREALGRDVAYTVSNDFLLMRAAIDRGVPIGDIKRKSAVAKDLETLDVGLAAALGLER